MGWFKPKPDPISDRARALTAQIAVLEAKIQKLEHADPTTRVQREAGVAEKNLPASAPAPTDPVFMPTDRQRLQGRAEAPSTPEHYNELGVRKYDLAAAWRRCQDFFRGAPPVNPQLINYLAAGSIQGLRPMRYEKRVARNRVILLCVALLLALWAILAIFFHGH